MAGFNLAKTIKKAFPTGFDLGQDDDNKGICSPGSLSIIQLDSTALMLHFNIKDNMSLIFQMLQISKYYFIFFNQHRKKIICIKCFQKISLSHFCTGHDQSVMNTFL